MNSTFIGIDVGGERKGFHAIALKGAKFIIQYENRDPTEIVKWAFNQNAMVIAVDAPCLWSINGVSRKADRELNRCGIHCFYTPSKQKAQNNKFYKWMLNGERLYKCLDSCYTLFKGKRDDCRMYIETYPHAIMCALAGKVVSAKPKLKSRREALQNLRYNISNLSKIDYIDAALCAITADAFFKDKYSSFGDSEEGFIIVPECRICV